MALKSASRNRIVARFKRILVVVVVVAYLGTTSLYFCFHALGLASFQVLGLEKRNPMDYMWTWDMFPGYESLSKRRLVIGTTDDGTVVRLIPGENDHFRWGVDNVASRIDLNRYPDILKSAVDRALLRYQNANPKNPIETVYVIDHQWSSKYNFPDDLYEKKYGIEKVTRKYWDLLDVRNVREDGTVIWGN